MSGTILYTGISQRLGFYCAKSLIQEGYSIIGTYRRDENKANLDELNQLGAQLVQVDFTQEKDVDRLIDHVLGTHSSLRGIVHNASSWSKDGAASKSHQIAHAMFCVHSIAPYRINLALGHLLGKTAIGDVIHITDYVVDTGSDNHIAYAASKAALANMTSSLARKWAPNIKVNSIAPSLLQFNEQDNEAYRQKALGKSLLGIEPGPQVMLDTLRYILNNPYLTGQTITLDGGRSLKQP